VPSTAFLVVAWLALIVGFASAGWIADDIYRRGHRQQMGVMEAVWPITALYFGVVALVANRRWGRAQSPAWVKEQGLDHAPELPWAATVATGVAGCTLGDILAEFVVFFASIQLLGLALPAEYIGDYTLALLLGIAFQYFAIAPSEASASRTAYVPPKQTC
jgi:hypothetical protein